MPTDNEVHLATLVRLQVTVTALQAMLHATQDLDMTDELYAARVEAQDALQIAFGFRNDVPASITARWQGGHMADNADRILRDGTPQ